MEDLRLRRLKLRNLHVVDAVAEAGSMAKAAPRLGMSQPAVSRVVADMEHLLGVPLFDRTSTGVELTRFGQALRRRTTAVTDELTQGLGELAFLADPTQGEVRIGTTEPMTALTATIIQNISDVYGRIRFVVSAGDTLALHEKLRHREIDIAVTRMAADFDRYQDLVGEALFEDELAVIAGKHNPLVRRRHLTLRSLMNEKWLLGTPATSFLRPFIEEAFRFEGLDVPAATVTCGSYAMQINLLAAGPFLAILPRATLRYPAPHPTLAPLRVRMPTTRRPVGLVRLKHRHVSPTVNLFCRVAREAAVKVQ
ncbi:LysR family transcriptional regulator [Bradyrhizobium yuanmingense]|uniref:LysR family transcriptional regulator n=1 Tax=Bradyrhizobium yuanmingense TaxID=108015 RepID=UPI0023B8BCF1|nr:LysR family transcriptional regulator [Bradyrhizobium yuanmingense]MDF0517104.1 LysR family transcriptional regulator [Bradyrhizobium yuanmingense]